MGFFDVVEARHSVRRFRSTPIGYPDEQPEPAPRRPLEEWVGELHPEPLKTLMSRAASPC